VKEEKRQTIDSKYIQQHLANERTYLAWVRTSITIMGVGFLITNLHFSTLSEQLGFGDFLSRILGLAAIALGLSTLLITTISYFRKAKDINNQTFAYSKGLVLFLSISFGLVFLIFGLYYIYAWELI